MAPDLKDKLEKWDPAEHEGKDVFDKWSIDSQLRKGMERQGLPAVRRLDCHRSHRSHDHH